jgi:hypothetical protein
MESDINRGNGGRRRRVSSWFGEPCASSARLSECRLYRYALWRIWDERAPRVLFVGLNPSTADESTDDATVRRCIGFSKSWGYGGLFIANLFALRSKCPSKLRRVNDPVGPDNDEWLLTLARASSLVIAAWGTKGKLGGRDAAVLRLFPSIHCLDLTLSGCPRHPLYAPANLRPKLFH